jgi:hypothetical protein
MVKNTEASMLAHNPEYETELQTIKDLYEERLKKLMGEGTRISIFTNKSESGEQHGVVVFNEEPEPDRDVKYILYADHDDTMEAYSVRKSLYAKDLYKNIKDVIPGVSPENFAQFVYVCNEVCRALPSTGTHPKRYSPLLEMALVSRVLSEFDQGGSELMNNPTDANIQRKLHEVISEQFDGLLSLSDQGDKGFYIKEDKNQALAVNWKKRPEIVSEAVWKSYTDFMVKRVMLTNPESYNFGKEFYLIPTTFGQIDFQPEKVISFWETVKQETGRAPDGIIFFTRGRKEGFLEKFDNIIRKLLNKNSAKSIALDDSMRQLEAYSKSGQFILIRAIREGAKRSNEKALPGLHIKELRITDNIENLGERIKSLV